MTEYERLNTKYGRFIVTRFDANRMRSVQVGPEYSTIEGALAYIDKRQARSRWPLMVDLPQDLRRAGE